MPASFSTISAALMNDRTDKVIRNLLQTDVAAWAKLPIKGRTWTGDVSIIVLRASRNNSVVSVLGTNEPAAGQQGFLRLTVQSKRILGKGQIDLFSMVSADDAKGSVAVEPADELEGLLDDITRKLTRYAFQGGGGLQGIDGLTPAGSPIGMIWQRSNAITTYGYNGRFDDIVASGGQAFNFARFIRLDTYAQVGADTLITDITERTITLNANIDTSALPVGVPCAVMIVGAASQAFVPMTISGDNSTGNPVVLAVPGPNSTEVGAMIGDPTGFISNLTQPLHFGNNRATTTDPKLRRLRSNFFVCNDNNAQGGDILSSFEFSRMTGTIRQRAGTKPAAHWMSWLQQLAYPQSLMGTADANVRVNAQEGPKKLDPSAPANDGNDTFNSNTSAAGIPVYCSDMCPEGMIVTMDYKGWERLFKGPMEGVWVGATGPGTTPLVKTQGQTQYEFVRALFPEQVCTVPLSQGVMCGIAAAT